MRQRDLEQQEREKNTKINGRNSEYNEEIQEVKREMRNLNFCLAVIYTISGAFFIGYGFFSVIPIIDLNWVPLNSTEYTVLRDIKGNVINASLGDLAASRVGPGVYPVVIIGFAWLLYGLVCTFVFMVSWARCCMEYGWLVSGVRKYAFKINYLLAVIVCTSLAGHITIIEFIAQFFIAFSSAVFFYLGDSDMQNFFPVEFRFALVFELTNWGLIMGTHYSGKNIKGTVTAVIMIQFALYLVRFIYYMNDHRLLVEYNLNRNLFTWPQRLAFLNKQSDSKKLKYTKKQFGKMVCASIFQLFIDITLIALVWVSIA